MADEREAQHDAEVEALAGQVTILHHKLSHAETTAERYREALERIATWSFPGDDVEAIRDSARAALGDGR